MIYVGSSTNVQKRLNAHKSYLTRNLHQNPHLQNSWNKHGSDAFTFEAIEYCSKADLVLLEQGWIDYLRGHLGSENLFNIRCKVDSNRGLPKTAKWLEAMKGRPAWNSGKRNVPKCRYCDNPCRIYFRPNGHVSAYAKVCNLPDCRFRVYSDMRKGKRKNYKGESTCPST